MWIFITFTVLFLQCTFVSVYSFYVIKSTNSTTYESENEGENRENIFENSLPSMGDQCIYNLCRNTIDFSIEPINNTIVYSLQPDFKWHAPQNGIYRLTIYTQFDTVFFYRSKPILLDTTYKFTNFLQFNTTYKWVVLLCDNGCESKTFDWYFTTFNPLVNLHFPDENYITTVKPTYIQWSKPKGEVNFNIQISTDIDFQQNFFVNEYNYPDSVYHTNWLIKNKLFYWRVQALHGPKSHTWSDVRTILVLDTTLKKVFPDSASSVTDTAITLRWNKLEGTNNYSVKLSTSSQFFNTIVDSSTVQDTFLHVPKLEKNKIYYWTISSSTDVINVPSSVWRFTTQTKPKLVEPPNKLADAPKFINFKWRRQGQLSTTSFFQLSDKADFSTLIDDVPGILDTTYFYDGTNTLKQNTTYHWRVKQLVSDDTTAWSDVWTFRLPGLPMVTQRYPDSNAIGVPVDTLLHWNPASDIDGYTVRVSTVPTFVSTVLVRSPLMNVLFTDINNLEHNRKYYWQSRTRKDGEFGEWSDIWDFLTILAKPNLLQPGNEAIVSTTSVNFSWQSVIGSEKYDIQIATDSTFANPIVNEEGIVPTAFDYKALTPETLYFWQVKSTSTQNIGQWSTIRKFTTNTINSVGEVDFSDVEIIPNPVNSNSIILIRTQENERTYSVTIRNLLGSAVVNFPISKTVNNELEYILNANGLPQGMYFLEITTSKKTYSFPFQLLR